jgi:hypothetical protein
LSYSFREPEEPAVCDCKYDEIQDRMEREDCLLHCDLLDDVPEIEASHTERKRPTVETESGGACKRGTKTA